MEGRDPYEDYLAINKELSTYNLRKSALIISRRSYLMDEWLLQVMAEVLPQQTCQA
ncbi:hypothetical protein EfmJHP10_12940 [Enterococcus faecium]|nr:hypothetical protein EfmJHP10_12940 [Enterococcus faecium]